MTHSDDIPGTNSTHTIELPPSSPVPSRRTASVSSKSASVTSKSTSVTGKGTSVTSSSSSRKGQRTTSDQRKKDKTHSCDRTCHRDLAKLLVYEERETRDLTHLLRQLHDQLAKERDRADEAERRLAEVFDSIKVVNEARMVAVAQAAHAREELAMYKVRWSEAHEEVVRAQKMVEDLDSRRLDAEEDAAKMRTLVREMREDRLINNAREEGRQMGLNEGLRTRGFVSQSTRRRYQTPSSSEGEGEDTEDENGGSRAPSVSQMSRMSVPLRTPYMTPAAPPMISVNMDPRPISPNDVPTPTPIRNSPASSHAPFTVPPDGWIPEVGGDSFIHIPPPHELSKPVLSPDASPSVPQPPQPLPVVEPPQTPAQPAPTPGRRRRGHTSSPESQSTTFSDFDLVQPNMRSKSSGGHLDINGMHMKTPLSVINEVLSVNSASPNPVPAPPPPHITVSPRMDTNEHIYRRPVSTYSSDNSPVQSRPKLQSNHTSSSSIPDINILPPSRPVSDDSGRAAAEVMSERHPSPGGLLLSPAAAMSPTPVQVPPPVPGAYRDSGYFYSPAAHTPNTSGEPPVIPDAALRRRAGDDETYESESGTETPSSGMSADTLTTPVHKHRHLNSISSAYSAARVPLPPSTTGAATPRVFSQYGGSVYSEARVPLPPSEMGRMTPKTPSVLGGYSRSKKGSISSIGRR